MVFSVGKNEIVSPGAGLRGVLIRCDIGLIWVTVAGDSSDHILLKGDEMVVSGKGKIVIMAEKWSSVCLLPPTASDFSTNPNPRRRFERSLWQEIALW
jgi:hypothetical protein